MVLLEHSLGKLTLQMKEEEGEMQFELEFSSDSIDLTTEQV